MAKLLSAAQLQELKSLSATNKPLRSVLEIVQSGRTQSLTLAQKKLLQKALDISPQNFAAAVEARLGAADPPKAPAAKPAAKPARQTVSDRVKNSLKSNAKAGQEATQAATNTAKKTATEATKKGVKAAARTTAKAGEAVVTGAAKVGNVAGRLAPAAKVLGKVLGKAVKVGEIVNVAKILATDEGKQEAKDYAQNMSENGTIVRAVKSLWSPSDTIAGAGMNAYDALTSHYKENMRGAELDRTKDARVQESRDRMNALRATRAAKKEAELAKVEASDEPAVPEEVEPAISESEASLSDHVDQRLSENPPAEPKKAEPAPNDAALEAEAEPVVDYTDEATGLFKNTHGTSFDNKSAMDREKLEKMKAALAEQGGLGGMTPNQFALKLYRSS